MNRRGTVLIVVMVIVFAIAAMVLTLARQVSTQALASANELAAQKADAAERGAEQYVLSLLTDYRDSLSTMTQEEFTAVPVGDAFFWITRPTYNDDTAPDWGLLDEASKISLNTAVETQLIVVPGMTEELASSIVQWRGTGDATADPTSTDTAAAAAATVTTVDGAKNAPFETVEELMLMPGMTRELLHGPPGGATAAANANVTEWYQTHGIFDYFTAWSTWPNTAADGTKRLSVKTRDNRDALETLLGDKLANQARATEILNVIMPAGGRGPGGRRNPPPPIDVIDIFDFAQKAGLTQEQFVAVEDFITTEESTVTTLKGKININTAPREVLLTLPGLTEDDVSTLISQRTDAVAAYPNSIAWVSEALKDKAVGIGNLVCGQGRQFSADIVAASGNGRGFRRVRIVVDTTSSPARIVYRRDLTDQGWPLDATVLEQLKAGTFAGGQTSNPTASGSMTGAR